MRAATLLTDSDKHRSLLQVLDEGILTVQIHQVDRMVELPEEASQDPEKFTRRTPSDGEIDV